MEDAGISTRLPKQPPCYLVVSSAHRRHCYARPWGAVMLPGPVRGPPQGQGAGEGSVLAKTTARVSSEEAQGGGQRTTVPSHVTQDVSQPRLGAMFRVSGG